MLTLEVPSKEPGSASLVPCERSSRYASGPSHVLSSMASPLNHAGAKMYLLLSRHSLNIDISWGLVLHPRDGGGVLVNLALRLLSALPHQLKGFRDRALLELY